MIRCGSSTWRSGTSPRPQATSWPRPSSPFLAGTPLWQLYLAVRNFTTPTGNELAEAFLSLPSRYRQHRIRILLFSSLTFKMPIKKKFEQKFFCIKLFEDTFTSFFIGKK
jgi:hypothetical protein